MSCRDDQALVVLVDGDQSAGLYVDGGTCLYQVERLAEFVDASFSITIYFGLTGARWDGFGRLRPEHVGQGRLFA